jgi:hypothetical protein
VILKTLSDKISTESFLNMSRYLGIAIESHSVTNNIAPHKLIYVDLEIYFLTATYNLSNSRIAEGFICWLIRYGHLLSPSKVRRLIQQGAYFDSAVLGVFLCFIIENKINYRQWQIIKKFTKASRTQQVLLEGPIPRHPQPQFLKYNLVAPNFKFETDKYLLSTKSVFTSCLELRNRALFGSVANADVASYLARNPNATAYEIALATHHYKARVFTIYEDIRIAM